MVLHFNELKSETHTVNTVSSCTNEKEEQRGNLRCMPSNMAMHKPNTRIIRLKSQDNPTSSRHKSSVTTRGISQSQGNRWVISSKSLSQDEEIVTVQMEGMWQWDWRLDNNVDPLLWLRKLDEESTAFGWESLVFPDGEEGWIVVFGHEGCSTDVPFVKLGAVACDDDIESALGDIGISDRHGSHWDEIGHGFINTLASVGVSITAGSVCDRGAIVVDDSSDVQSLDGSSASVLVVSAQEETSSGIRSLDDHIVTLTNVDVQDVRGVWRNWNEIRSDDSELMVVEVKLVCGLDSAIDESEQVFLSWCESLWCDETRTTDIARLVVAIPDVHTIDETCVKQDGAAIGSGAIWKRGSVLCKIVSRIHGEM